MFKRLVVVGVGLIGGSFALALKRAGLVGHVVGVGRGTANLQQALQLGVIDEIGSDSATAYAGADLVFIATPVGQMGAVMAAMASHLSPTAIITDGGSTKQDVVALAEQHLAQHLTRFVPAHPIAGAEKSGVDAAFATLYVGKKTVLAPTSRTAPEAILQVQSAWEACGARVSTMSPELHDKIFAAVSHLPHLLAFALVDEIAAKPHAELLFDFAGAGFRDSTRIAGGHPEMWRDIMLANQAATLTELDEFMVQLQRVRAQLAARDSAALTQVFTRARDARAHWLSRIEAGAPPNQGPGA